MSEDLIRRSDAIDVIRERLNSPHMQNALQQGACLSVLRAIEAIPTIEPKQGEWIFKTIFPNDKSEFPMGYLVCSVCGSHHSNSTPCNYCDNCGSRMKGADDE